MSTRTWWVHVIHDNCLEQSRPLVGPVLTVGSRALCDVRLRGRGIRAEHARFLLAADGRVRYQVEGARAPRDIEPGSHVEIGPYTLSLERRADIPVGFHPKLPKVLDLAPLLWSASHDEEIFSRLLDTLLDVFPAEWAAFLSMPSPGEALRILSSRGSRARGDPMRVSQTVIDKILQTGEAVLVGDVQTDPNLAQAYSIPVQIRTVIAAPLVRDGEYAGIVYLESSMTGGGYTHEERNLLGLICSFAAAHLEQASQKQDLVREKERLECLRRAETPAEADPKAIIGESPAIRAMHEQIQQVAATDVTTLVLGETGSGKELVAHAIHRQSRRCGGPFVPIHCMAIPGDLVEGELFGHVRGAFSGAHEDRMGRIESAHRGTLFLDEVGELSAGIQVKLLRVLQDRTIQRLGERRDRVVDTRLIAATNAELGDRVADGSFREDLFYRLSVFVIRIPPLRERPGDLAHLIEYHIRMFNRTFGRRIRGMEPEAMAILEGHRWPGNVRELRNVLEQAFVRERHDRITAESLSLGSVSRHRTPPTLDVTYPDALDEAKALFEKDQILRILEAERGNVPRVLERLRISRASLYSKLTKHGVDLRRWRT